MTYNIVAEPNQLKQLFDKVYTSGIDAEQIGSYVDYFLYKVERMLANAYAQESESLQQNFLPYSANFNPNPSIEQDLVSLSRQVMNFSNPQFAKIFEYYRRTKLSQLAAILAKTDANKRDEEYIKQMISGYEKLLAFYMASLKTHQEQYGLGIELKYARIIADAAKFAQLGDAEGFVNFIEHAPIDQEDLPQVVDLAFEAAQSNIPTPNNILSEMQFIHTMKEMPDAPARLKTTQDQHSKRIQRYAQKWCEKHHEHADMFRLVLMMPIASGMTASMVATDPQAVQKACDDINDILRQCQGASNYHTLAGFCSSVSASFLRTLNAAEQNVGLVRELLDDQNKMTISSQPRAIG